MSAINYTLSTGSRQVLSDINSAKLGKEGTTQTENLQIQQWYKLLKTCLKINGQIKCSVSTAPTEDTEFFIEYQNDHFYNLISNFQLRLNSNYEVKNFVNLAYLRYLSLLMDEGYSDLFKIPKSVIIKSGQTETYVDFEVFIPLNFMLFDMQGSVRAFIATWLYNAIQATWRNEADSSVFNLEAKNADSSASATLSIVDKNIESASNYWITGPGVFSGSSTNEVLNKLGGFYRTTSFTEYVSLGAKGALLDKFTPTTNMNLGSSILILRDSLTNKRIDGVIENFRFTDGTKPLFDIKPEYLRQDLKSRYKLSLGLFNNVDSGEVDGMGALHGIHKIDTTYFGELENAILAVGNWQRPKLYLDMKTDSSELSAGAQVKIEVYQNFYEVPQMLQNMSNQFVATTQGNQ